MRRPLSIVLASVVLVTAWAASAAAQATVLSVAAQRLRSDPVYVDPAAERSRDVDAGALSSRIRRGGSPMFVAVLPASAAAEVGGDSRGLPQELARQVGLQGTYAVIAGNSFRAGSNVLPSGRAGALATSSFQAKSGSGTEAVLETFVDRVNAVSSGSGDGDGSGGSSSTSRGGGGALLLLLVLGGGGLFLWSRSRRRRQQVEQTRELAADRQMLQAELSVLGDDVMSLEPEVTMHPEARNDYDAGVTRFKSAEAAMAYAEDEVDLVRVQRVVEEGRYAMARARARVEGREPPAPPEDLRRPGRRNEPALDLDDAGTPVYVGYGGPWYGGGGWFGGGSGGLLTGLLLGNMLGGGWGGGWGGYGGGWGGGYYDGDDRGDDRGDDGGGWGGGDGGDWGGGDIGGGDFGGGDFGGGDVGGGDW